MNSYLTKGNFLIIVVIYIALQLTDFNQSMTSYWIGPYLSAAINFDWSDFVLRVDMNEIKEFSKLSTSQMFLYSFSSTDDLIEYDYLAKGLVFALIFSKKVFFWLGDLESLQYLQYIIHIVLSIVILNLFEKKYQKVLFFFLYVINPLILWVVNYPFYYFWQVIPSAIFIYWHMKKCIKFPLFLVFSVIFAYIYISRPTVLFLIVLFYILYALKNSYKQSFTGFILFLILISLTPKLSIGPWHTAYVGIGAYSNKYNIELSDNSGYKFYKDITGKVVNSGNIMVKEIKEDYYNHLKERLIEIVKEFPMMFVKNAIFNTIQAYSIGYSHSLNKKYGNKLIYLSLFIGIMMISFLIYTKQYIIFLAIGFSTGSFTIYYPPILTYMYGNFILLVVGFIGIIEYFLRKKQDAK